MCVLGKLRFELKKESYSFSFSGEGWGVFWVSSDLNSGKKVCFSFSGEGCSGTKFQNRGVLENLVKNFWNPSWLVHHR